MASGRIYEGFVPGRHLIDSYGAGGFRFADMSHRGSILALPSGIMAWSARSAADFSVEAFAPVFAEADRIDTLLIGTGLDPASIPEALRSRLKEARVGVDSMQTGAATRTYNILAAENRRVAAALLAVG